MPNILNLFLEMDALIIINLCIWCEGYALHNISASICDNCLSSEEEAHVMDLVCQKDGGVKTMQEVNVFRRGSDAK